MKTQQLFIPDKIKVGFQKREGTYTGKLAYVVYYDNKGVLRKEKSWQYWRDKKIAAVEFDNVPTEGFVLNKGVGGQRESHSYNARNEYIRVYDPRDFEFEISVANLLFILRETDCSRGKGLEGQFVYAWDGTELVLLPAASQDYKNSKNFTQLQTQNVNSKDLIPGASYTTKKQENLIYLGKFDYYFQAQFKRGYNRLSEQSYELNPPAKADKSGVCKKFVFWDGKEFLFLNELKNIAVLNSDAVTENYASLVDKYNKSEHGSRVAKLFLKEVPEQRDDRWCFEESDGVFVECVTAYRSSYSKDKGPPVYIQACHKYYVKDGVFIKEDYNAVAYAPGKHPDPYYGERQTKMPWRVPTEMRLFAEMENGKKIRVTYNNFEKVK